MATDIDQKIAELEAASRMTKAATETVDQFYARILASAGSLSVEQQRYSSELNNQIRLLEKAAETRRDEIVELRSAINLAESIEEQEQKKLQLLRLELEEEIALNGAASSRATTLKNQIISQKQIVENLQKQKVITDALTGGIGTQIKSYFTMSGQLKNISEIFTSIMEGNSEYARTTGQVAERTVMFGYGASQFGIGFEKMNKSAMTLFTSMSGFSDLNKEVQENLALSAAKLENVGVSAETSGKNMDILMKTFKMSSEQAIQTNEELARVAIASGIAPSKMVQGFAEQMPRLAAYGKQALQVYTDLQKQAKSLGVEIGTLTSIVGDTMDTFEGSAKAAGKFNAVLGGNYLNSIEMLNATESERVVILKRAFEQSGKNFDSLSKYEKKAIAATLGIQNLDDATKLFSKSTMELQMQHEKEAASQKKLEEVQREAAKTTEQIKELFNGLLIVLRPIVTAIKNVVDVLTYFNDKTGGSLSIILSLTAAFVGLKKAFDMASVMNKTTLILTGLVVAFQLLHYWLLEPHSPILYFALLALPFIIRAIGEAADKGKNGLFALGAAIMMIGAGVYIASLGLAEMVKSFNGLGDAAPYAAISVGIFSLAFLGLMALLISLVAGPQAALTGAAIGVLLSVGATALMIGAGMALASLGIAKIIESLGGLAEVASKLAPSMLQLSLSFIAFSASLASIMLLGAAGGTGLGLIALASGIAMMVTTVLALSAALETIPDQKVLSLKTFNETLTSVKNLKEEDLKPTKELILAVKDYYDSQQKSKEADKDAFVTALREVVGSMNQFGGGEEGNSKIPIKLVIGNGRELAAELRPMMREKYKETLGLRK